MSDTDRHDPDDDHQTVDTDGGVAAREEQVDYLTAEINLFRPATPFMRDHLRIVWTMFVAWVVVVFGPVTATWLAPDLMTNVTVIGFPLHYLLTAIGAPGGALVLSIIYARRRDRLDEKYGIEHGTAETGSADEGEGDATAADGGVEE